MEKYTIGLDYGTLSLRAVVVDVENGTILGSHVHEYRHGVMDSFLKDSKKPLPKDFALQDGKDYIEALNIALPKAIEESGVNSQDIIAVAVDFTACTMLPMKKDGRLLSEIAEFEEEPMAYTKLWKHHGAEKQALKISELAKKRGEQWIERYGGKISSEWMLPKVLETYELNHNVYSETDVFIEAGDYITYYLTGILKRSSCQAGYKNIWHDKKGYISKAYLHELNENLTNLYDTKLGGEVISIGQSQGTIRKKIADKLGLNDKVKVSVSIIDAHVALPACQVTNSGDMLMIMGTSSCDIVLSDQEIMVQGISGVVKDGAIPDLFAYESGQPAVGDIFAWFMENQVPASYYELAKEKDISIYELMEQKMKEIPKNKNRILALDWWNGNRSILIDPDLTGVCIGMDLRTKPEEIYRAIVEATAFGKKKIIETYEDAGVKINKLVACGGLAIKSPFIMQIYADIIGRDIFIADSLQAPALGAAIFASVTVGKELGGYDSLEEASLKMGKVRNQPFSPTPENEALYNSLYDLYTTIHDYFGIHSDIMKKLRQL